MHVHYFPPWIGLVLTIVVCGGAFWKGDREQQLAAAGVLLSWGATVALRDPRWIGPQWGAFWADVANLGLLVWIAVRSPRYWPLVAAAFQLLCVMTHVARMVDPAAVRAWAYASGQVIFTQWLLIAIGVGVWNTWRSNVRAKRAYPAASDAPIAAPGAATRR